jgi:hypothetical protein
MIIYPIVTVTPAITDNRVQVTPTISNNEILASASVTNKIQVNNTSNYNLLQNKPQIESVELSGNKSFNDLGLSNISNMWIEQLIKGGQ